MIYTSGSTGRPKGTLIPHRSVLHILDAIHSAVFAGRGSSGGGSGGSSGGSSGPLRIGVASSWIFDASIEQILLGLLGNTLVIVPEEARTSGEEMVALLEREHLDLLESTPAQVQAWLEAGLLERPGAAPRFLLVGGEALAEGTWRALAAAPETVSWNLCGPTECTIDSTCRQVAGERVVLGRPLRRVQAYVLDRRGGAGMAPLPPGVAGELYLGGAGLGRGYLGRPALTAERFLPDPLGGVAGGRLYRSGDLVRSFVDGSLDFLGRVDRQVKLRGVRIELEEVEAVLAALPGVRAVAAVLAAAPAGARLVAYVAGETTAAELAEGARKQLPAAMVPSLFVVLPALPLTLQGKVDRRSCRPASRWRRARRPKSWWRESSPRSCRSRRWGRRPTSSSSAAIRCAPPR